MLSMRSLKSINRIQKLKNVCLCLIKSVGSILNLLLIAILLTFMFSVMGVHMLEGKFFFCTDSSKKTEQECLDTEVAAALLQIRRCPARHVDPLHSRYI